MKTFQLDINGATQLTYEMNISFDRMADELDVIEKDVLNVGATSLKQKVKQSMTSKFPAASRPVRNQLFKGKRSKDGYPITTGESLSDAVRQTRVDLSNKTTKVHILGSGRKNSPTFMARFYENGTEIRYATRYAGKVEANKRSTGRLKGYRFFLPTVEGEMNATMDLMGEVYEHKIKDIMTND